jgi:hypothetical protein
MTEEHVVWMQCPYPPEVCVEPATWEPGGLTLDADEVAGVAVCSAGHRWRIVKLPNDP